MSEDKVLLEELSWREVRTLQAGKPIVIIPTGSIEQHGPHLPLEKEGQSPQAETCCSRQPLASN